MNLRRRGLAALCGAAVLAACAPDAWRAGNDYDAFLNKVSEACYYDAFGATNVGTLLQPGGSGPQIYFIDETSRLYYGKITKQNWLLAITSQFQVNESDKGVKCILAELDKEKAAKPK